MVPCVVFQALALHALDDGQAEPRRILLLALALGADRIGRIARLEKHFHDGALIGAIALGDEEPAVGLAGFGIDILPQPGSARLLRIHRARAKAQARQGHDGEGCKMPSHSKHRLDSNQTLGELVEGDAKKIWKAGIPADDQGQFWDNKGHVIGKAKTLPQEDKEDEAEFAGLEGLIVVADGWVEDENGNRVGKIVDGDAKKLVGRAVDEDGDVIDKKGNVVGHAERYEEPDAEPEAEPEEVDLSELKGLKVNKQGNVIGPDGVPIGRLVEGNAKELAGRPVDGEGQVWNDRGEVVGRVELIPANEREAKAEGPFAGLEGVIVVKDGLVEDHEGNVVGKVVDGDWKKLLGRLVDEDGDIIDKYGNVKGHAEPYEIPEEEVVEDDLSSLAGKTVNKQGKIVDEHGTIFGEVAEGELKHLVGKKVDGKGNIWSTDGKIIGKGRLIEGGDDGRAEGPFSTSSQPQSPKTAW